IIDARCAIKGWIVHMSVASRRGSINVDGNEFRIDDRGVESCSGGFKKLLVVQDEFGAFNERLPGQGPVATKPRRDTLLLPVFRFIFQSLRGIGRESPIWSIPLKHGADLFAVVKCGLDANRFSKCHVPSRGCFRRLSRKPGRMLQMVVQELAEAAWAIATPR